MNESGDRYGCPHWRLQVEIEISEVELEMYELLMRTTMLLTDTMSLKAL